MLDLTAAAMEEGGDDLHRVFYVGVTRTLKTSTSLNRTTI